MNKHNALFLILLWSLIFFPSIGRSSTLERELSEPEFTALLVNYQKFVSMTVPFVQTKTLKDLGIKLSSEGKLSVIRPDQIIWQIEKPGFMKAVINSNEISIQSGKNAEIEKWPLNQAPGKTAQSLKEMTLWLKLEAHELYQHFHIIDLGNNRYSFQARGKTDSDFINIIMSLGPKKNVATITMVEQSGDLIKIKFNEPQFQNSP